MATLAQAIDEKETLYRTIEARIVSAEADASGARAALAAVTQSLVGLKQIGADVAKTKGALTAAAAAATPRINAAAAEVEALGKALSTVKDKLPDDLDAIEKADLATPPDPALKTLAQYDAAVATDVAEVAKERKAVEEQRAAVDGLVAALRRAEIAAAAMSAELDAALAELARLAALGAAVRAEARHQDAAAARFHLRRQLQVARDLGAAVTAAAGAVDAAADAVATANKGVEAAESRLAAAAAKLAAKQTLAAAARAQVERAIRAKVG